MLRDDLSDFARRFPVHVLGDGQQDDKGNNRVVPTERMKKVNNRES